jgi:cob(I)alamin adenosyltransferase
MNERQWELYRLSVVVEWSESPYKRAVLAAIEHKLMILGQDLATRQELENSA